MEEVRRVHDLLERAWDGGAWHGPAVHEVLEGVDAQTAAARPLAGAHSIREIVLHLAAWEGAVLERLGGTARPEPEEGDWPKPADGEGAWGEALALLTERNRRLRATVAGLEGTDLARGVTGQEYDVAHMLHGAVQHAVYHAGQIALLRKAAGEP